MPELPEVEVTRRGLRPALCGRVLTGVQLGQALRWPLGCAPQELCGQTIAEVARRGKYLLLQLDRGELIVHLGMSGSLRWLEPDQAAAEPPGRHDHAVLLTDRGQLRLRDPRRFGAVVWHARGQAAHPLLAGLGPEPLGDDFDGAVLARALSGRSAAVKTLLLDQRVVAGVGNIYASEALFDAGVDPRLAGGRLSRARCARLAQAVRATLEQAVTAGGSSLRDFAHVDGGHGCFQLQTRVYDREGQPCTRCGSLIRKITQGQRSTYFCPRCQKR